MRFGFMEDFRNPQQWRRPFPQFYQEILGQIKQCEKMGFDNIWLTEHHFTDDGYNPSLMTTAAAVAEQMTADAARAASPPAPRRALEKRPIRRPEVWSQGTPTWRASQ